jgi:hypothetical protein
VAMNASQQAQRIAIPQFLSISKESFLQFRLPASSRFADFTCFAQGNSRIRSLRKQMGDPSLSRQR